MSNFNGDLLDEGLQNVMGKDRCQVTGNFKKLDPDQQKKILEMADKMFADEFPDEKKATSSKKKTVPKAEKKVRNAQWEPVKENTYMDKVKACAKDALLFGGLSLIFFYFQQTGQMLPSAAMPCICVCCILLGLGVGKNAR